MARHPKIAEIARRGRTAVRAAALAVLAAQAAAAAPAPLRIGVAALPPESPTPAARLYTDEGFERDLARGIGRALGREVILVEAPDAAAALAADRVDLALARLPEGAQAGAEAVETGYGSALGLSMRTDTDIRDWGDLAGRTLCLSAENAEARRLAEAAGARVRAEGSPARSLMRVRTGECDAALHDAALLAALFEREGWGKFSAGLPPRAPSRLVALLGPDPALAAEVRAAAAELGAPAAWEERRRRWARNVAFEVFLDQDAPDCH